MTGSVTIDRRFNGPLDSGNGGYASGLFATALGAKAAEVTLRRPVPLDRSLEVERQDDTAQVLDGDELVAEAIALPALDLEVPAAPSVPEARDASGRYPGLSGDLFSRCFVCGLDREDAFGVFAGPVAERDLVASPWTPPAWTAGEDGTVRPEFVWAVLDCPTYFACYHDASPLPISFLGRLAASVMRPVRAETEHVVAGWPLGADDRKRLAAAAVYSAEGDVLAFARATLIEPRST